MYSTKEAYDMGHWFQETCLEYKGELMYVHGFNPDGRCITMAVNQDDDYEEETIILEEEFIEWSPRLPAGYYNLYGRAYWLSVSGARQYKVGLSSESVRQRNTDMPRLGMDFGTPAKVIIKAFNEGQVFPITMDTLKPLLDYGSAGITAELGAHRYPHSDLYLLAHNSKRAVGLLEGDTAYIQQDIDLAVPAYLRKEHVSTEDLLSAFRAGT